MFTDRWYVSYAAARTQKADVVDLEGNLVPSTRKPLFVAIGLVFGGLAAFFLFLFLMGHDPDERPLSMADWVIAGMLIGPGVHYLIRWMKMQRR